MEWVFSGAEGGDIHPKQQGKCKNAAKGGLYVPIVSLFDSKVNSQNNSRVQGVRVLCLQSEHPGLEEEPL
jgi:hypothetical protein